METQKNHAVIISSVSSGCQDKPVSSIGMPGAMAALAAISVYLTSCKKDQEGLYELNEIDVAGSAAEKNKQKTNQQFVSILHTNLFQSSISGSDIFELDRLFQSIGDKDIAKEILISNFFNDSGVQLPTLEEMNNNIDGFIDDTYKRFFVRLPNEAEKTWVKNFIQTNPYMTPELVFFAFALSNEYQFY